MINFDFYTPTRVLFGADRENEAGKQVAAFGGHKVMIIYGKKGGFNRYFLRLIFL